MNEDIEVLIIEDSQTQALRMRLILEEHGYRVTVATNGLEGINLFQERFFPIVITDWVMPEMSGIEFCRAVREQELDGYVFIILVTARGFKDDTLTGLHAGADDYLVKPVDPAELLARLHTGRRIIKLERTLKMQNEEIGRLLITDPLTKVFNRRYMNDKLPPEFERAERYKRSLSVVMCDLDHFKKINDRYGHLAGDQVLVRIGQCFMHSIREKIDWVSRYGGEEFVIVLPETELPNAITGAERFRLKIADDPVRFNGELIPVTASFGVASFHPLISSKPLDVEAIIAVADKCLYRAKEKGRNCCVGEML